MHYMRQIERAWPMVAVPSVVTTGPVVSWPASGTGMMPCLEIRMLCWPHAGCTMGFSFLPAAADSDCKVSPPWFIVDRPFLFSSDIILQVSDCLLPLFTGFESFSHVSTGYLRFESCNCPLCGERRIRLFFYTIDGISQTQDF